MQNALEMSSVRSRLQHCYEDGTEGPAEFPRTTVLSHKPCGRLSLFFKLTSAWIVPFSFVSLFKVAPTGGCDGKEFPYVRFQSVRIGFVCGSVDLPPRVGAGGTVQQPPRASEQTNRQHDPDCAQLRRRLADRGSN